VDINCQPVFKCLNFFFQIFDIHLHRNIGYPLSFINHHLNDIFLLSNNSRY
jgi:hypothetical protein